LPFLSHIHEVSLSFVYRYAATGKGGAAAGKQSLDSIVAKEFAQRLAAEAQAGRSSSAARGE